MKTSNYVIALLLLAALLAACSETPTPQATEAPAATDTAVPPTDTPQPTATAAPTASPTAESEALPTEEAAPEAAPVELERLSNETMGISVLVPEGWDEIATGAYARAQSDSDLTRMVQQAAVGAGAEDIAQALLPQLGIEALPNPVDTVSNASLTWDVYMLEVEGALGTVAVDVALAETETAAYVVLLQASTEEYEALHESVFLPALEGFQPSLEEEEGAVYEDPQGLFSVPVPTNWTIQESEQYVTLLGPEEGLTVHILALDGDDTKAAVEEAWQIVDPDFEQAETETVDIPPSAARGVDEFILVNYERDEDEPIVQVEGRRHQEKVYVLIFILDVETYQRRAAQVQIIDSGFDITGLE